MSILNEDINITPAFVGDTYRVEYITGSWNDDDFPTFNINGKWYEPDFSKLDGLLGHRQSKAAYAIQFRRYVVAAWLTCYVGSNKDIYVGDDRFNKIIRMVNRIYGFPMGTLEVEFTLNPGVLRIWHKEMAFSSIGAFKSNLINPRIYRGYDRHGALKNRDRGYYVVKPQAIKSHMLAVQRLLKYDVESNILEQ